MKATTVLFAAIAAAAFAGPANAVFKCTTAKGVVYQDRPCLEGSETDVRLTVPSGQIAPKVAAPTEDTVSPNRQRVEDRTQTVKFSRSSGDSPTKTTKRVEEKAEAGASDSDARRKDAPALERTTPMTPDQARKTEPSAKYYSTESFSAGSQTPMQMNCESPSGERRTFYLSDGKLTSI